MSRDTPAIWTAGLFGLALMVLPIAAHAQPQDRSAAPYDQNVQRANGADGGAYDIQNVHGGGHGWRRHRAPADRRGRRQGAQTVVNSDYSRSADWLAAHGYQPNAPAFQNAGERPDWAAVGGKPHRQRRPYWRNPY